MIGRVKSEEYYRLMITKGNEQIVLSVQGAKKIATVDRFDKLIGNVVPDESSPDLSELRKLVDIKTSHISYSNRLFPGHRDWNSCLTVDMCHLQRIFDQSWMEKTNQSHGGKCADC